MEHLLDVIFGVGDFDVSHPAVYHHRRVLGIYESSIGRKIQLAVAVKNFPVELTVNLNAVFFNQVAGGLVIAFAGDSLNFPEQLAVKLTQLLIVVYYEKGQPENVISKVTRDGKTFFVINDYQKQRQLYGELLREIQRITSEGDYEAARDLVEKYGVQVDQELHREVLERYRKLNLAPYAGFINPEYTPVLVDGKIVDVKISYPEDYVKQMLRYGKTYSIL